MKNSSVIYLEYYTSVLGVAKERLEAFFGKPIILADRNMVETEAAEIYETALTQDVSLLVVGDPLCATTHTDIVIRAKEIGVHVEIIHNASVMAAVASSGLQLYQFGYTVSIPLYEENWRPTSFYDRIKYNAAGGMHSLCLLDIKMKEPDPEMMAKGKFVFLPPRFMTVNVAIEQLLESEEIRQEGVISGSALAVGMARLGQPTQQIVFGTLNELKEVDFGAPLHSLALCGELHPLEKDYLNFFHVSKFGPN